jgi:hypothetical protein
LCSSFSAEGDWLAGESTAEDIDAGEVVSPALADIAETFCVREVFREHSSAVVIDFDLPQRFDSRSLEAKIESPNA